MKKWIQDALRSPGGHHRLRLDSQDSDCSYWQDETTGQRYRIDNDVPDLRPGAGESSADIMTKVPQDDN